MGKKYNKLYRAYYELRETLKDDYTFNYYIDGMDRADNGEDVHSGEIFSRYIDMDWVEALNMPCLISKMQLMKCVEQLFPKKK